LEITTSQQHSIKKSTPGRKKLVFIVLHFCGFISCFCVLICLFIFDSYQSTHSFHIQYKYIQHKNSTAILFTRHSSLLSTQKKTTFFKCTKKANKTIWKTMFTRTWLQWSVCISTASLLQVKRYMNHRQVWPGKRKHQPPKSLQVQKVQTVRMFDLEATSCFKERLQKPYECKRLFCQHHHSRSHRMITELHSDSITTKLISKE